MEPELGEKPAACCVPASRCWNMEEAGKHRLSGADRVSIVREGRKIASETTRPPKGGDEVAFGAPGLIWTKNRDQGGATLRIRLPLSDQQPVQRQRPQGAGGGMKHWTASVVAMLLASFPSVANAQADCNAVPAGPARTDCYLGLSQFYRGQSDVAAARARAQSDAAWYRAITGTDPPKHKPHQRR